MSRAAVAARRRPERPRGRAARRRPGADGGARPRQVGGHVPRGTQRAPSSSRAAHPPRRSASLGPRPCATCPLRHINKAYLKKISPIKLLLTYWRLRERRTDFFSYVRGDRSRLAGPRTPGDAAVPAAVSSRRAGPRRACPLCCRGPARSRGHGASHGAITQGAGPRFGSVSDVQASPTFTHGIKADVHTRSTRHPRDVSVLLRAIPTPSCCARLPACFHPQAVHDHGR